MPLPLVAAIVVGATWLSRIGLAVFAVNEIKKLLSDNKPTLDTASTQAEAAGLSANEQQKMAAAVTYEQVEKQGKSPDDFWGNLTPAEQQALKFSPESLRADTQRTTFLGIAQTLLWIAAGAALARAGFTGLPASLKGLSQIAALKQKGASAAVIANELAIVKMAILNKTWIPGSVAGILGTGGWIAGGLMNNLNDATLWGRIFLDQAHSDIEKAAANAAKLSAGSGGGSNSPDLPKTIIRMVREEKPMQFIGTLFSSKLGKAEQFDRHLDDKITDMQDLEADVKINLNKWLASLPNRMGYSIVIRKDPVDEFGSQQSGIWATLTMFMTHISGKTTPIDTILLGPVDPQVRLELQKKTTTIENHVSGFIEATKVKEIQIPAGSVDIFNANNERISLSDVSSSSAGSATPNTQNNNPTNTPTTPPAITRGPFIKLSNGQLVNTEFANADVVAAADRGVYQYVTTSDSASVLHHAGTNSYWAYTAQGQLVDKYMSEADAYRAIGQTMPAKPAPVTTAPKSVFPKTVTVTADALMVRSAPSSTAPLAGSQRLVRGNTFTAVDAVQGENVSGQSWWWKSSQGNYVWSGGTSE